MKFREFDINLLIVLDILLKENSVTRAAEKLGRSPSAVSHSLAKLRHMFSDDLFVQSGRGLKPTPKSLAIKQDIHHLALDIENLIAVRSHF